MASAVAADEATAAEVDINTGPMINIVIWLVTIIATVFLAMRLYCKMARNRQPWWDDYVLIASWMCLVSSNIVTTINVTLGFGQPSSILDPDILPTLAFLRLINASLSLLGVIWSKTAFAVTLLRLVQGKMLGFVWFLIVTGNLFFLGSVFFGWFQCNPVDKNWDMSIAGSCVNPSIRLRFNIAGGIYSGIMDIVLALVPWNVLRDLKLYTREKVGIGIAMSMGVFAGIAAFIKTSNINHSGAKDFNRDGFPIVLWSSVEIAITIAASSIPTLRALVNEVILQQTSEHDNHQYRRRERDRMNRLPSYVWSQSNGGKAGEGAVELAEWHNTKVSTITPFEVAMGVKYNQASQKQVHPDSGARQEE